MGELHNEFAFSFSRFGTMQDCARRYYLSYYGHWNGWKDHAPKLARDAYRLKQLSGMYMWAGSLVHDEIERTLNDVLEDQPVSYEISEKRMAQQSKREFKMSELRAQNPNMPAKSFGLKEHEYNEPMTQEFKAMIWGRAQACLANFFGMDIIDRIRKSDKHDILAVEGFAKFPVLTEDGSFEIPVYSMPDLAFWEDGKIIIYDWKTGKEKEGYEDQVAAYALFASCHWDAKPDQIEVNICYLLTGKEYRKRATPEWIENAERKIRNQSRAMMMKLVDQDPERNAPLDISHFPLAKNPGACRFCNFGRICGIETYRKTGIDPLVQKV